ncbi:MAG TPA: phytoene/squalene synthase family protein [Pyrinomonadaceae bacterium]|nr:phytoene/squalene synthase family protein [Pyrinomonadaceae bacterium]
MSSETERAYRYCRSVTKTHAKSFYFAAKFLPRHKQNPIYALYALCRHVDDEVDESGIENEREAAVAVESWRTKLDEIYARGGNCELRIANYESAEKINKGLPSADNGQTLVLTAWQDLLKKYEIPRNLPLELMKGVLMDTHVKRYRTFAELYVYCYRVASTVGLMSSEIFGYCGGDGGEKAREYAEALGIAMQLTNILRDVGEDASMNRIYLPAEDLRKFGVSEKQIFDNRADENFVDLMKFQIRRARRFYKKSEKGIPLLSRDARFAVLLASRFYAKILDEIERQNYDVFKRRAYTSFGQKVFSLPRIWREAKNLAAN